uniref:Uncharacterized protein n=1 Tax=Coccidioides posadasii RMSCC 3488 TaxID=454284 RepID=A0A0J6F4K0_COCPO|nr:hypothetical protein CPAG_01430 [Coccidioides posadasii RMSCC 3488]
MTSHIPLIEKIMTFQIVLVDPPQGELGARRTKRDAAHMLPASIESTQFVQASRHRNRPSREAHRRRTTITSKADTSVTIPAHVASSQDVRTAALLGFGFASYFDFDPDRWAISHPNHNDMEPERIPDEPRDKRTGYKGVGVSLFRTWGESHKTSDADDLSQDVPKDCQFTYEVKRPWLVPSHPQD